MNKVVLVNIEHFTPNRDRLFHVSDLIRDGFEVSVWDLSLYSRRGIDFPDVISADYIRAFRSFREIKSALAEIDVQDTFFIVQVPFYRETLPFYKELMKRKCYIATFNFYTNTLSVPYYHISIQPSLWHPARTLSRIYRKIRNYYDWRLHQFLWRNVKYDCYLSPMSGENITGHINHPDYDDFTFHRTEPELDYPYLVFCDNYFPYHPDLKGTTDGVDGRKYQQQMTELFDYMEEKTGLPIVIAAHPKAKYDGKEFGDRKIIKNKTNNLVTHSQGVIFHTSNSISYAVMANKKVVCVTTDDYNCVGSLDKYISALCAYFNIQAYNLDQIDLAKVEFQEIDESIRTKYIYSFLTSKETEQKDNYTIIKEAIKNAKPKTSKPNKK